MQAVAEPQTGPENEDDRATQAAEEFPILGNVKRPHPTSP